MPEGTKPPKTIQEVGIHLFYMAESQKDTNRSMEEIKQTLKDMQNTAVSRIDFDEHVIWGQNEVKDVKKRLLDLEEAKIAEDASVMRRVLKGLDAKIVAAIVLVMCGAFFYGTYMMIRYNALKGLTVTEVSK